MAKDSKGVFMISLDFELFWGIHDSSGMPYKENIRKVREVIPRLLTLFTKYDIHVTWATVGMLSCDGIRGIETHQPEKIPGYTNRLVSTYGYANRNSSFIEENKDLFFASDLIEQIKATANQELASHSFSHYFCNEDGQTVDDFSADLKSFKSSMNLDAKSFVFPRNQTNDEHLKRLAEDGFTSYRKLDDTRFHTSNGSMNRIMRLIDSYFSLTGSNSYPHSSTKSQSILGIPASRFYRAFSGRMAFLEQHKVQRIVKGIMAASEKQELYHLWWHPHNFSANIEENMKSLEQILKEVKLYVDEGKLESHTMQEYAEWVGRGEE